MDYKDDITLPSPSQNDKAEIWEEIHSPFLSQDIEVIETALEGIELRLQQMLALARLSASDSDVDRAALQKKIKWLKGEINRIADQIENG